MPEHFKETLESATGWVDLDDDPAPPSLSLQNIHQFFVTKRLRRDEVTASKPFEKGYRLFHGKKVCNVMTHHIQETSTYTIVRAAVTASQRDKIYKTNVAISNVSGEVIYGYCTCIAGRCSTCNHVAALLFYIDEHNRTSKSNNPTCTSKPCQWKKPGTQKPQAVCQ